MKEIDTSEMFSSVEEANEWLEAIIEHSFDGIYITDGHAGADRNGKIGLFEAANNGTIFLDEIGELPVKMQVKLLRVLQEKEIERIDSSKRVKVNVRVIAATNRNLEDMVEKKLFRDDLYYRLMVLPITIPPLRERRHPPLCARGRDMQHRQMPDKCGAE